MFSRLRQRGDVRCRLAESTPEPQAKNKHTFLKVCGGGFPKMRKAYSFLLAVVLSVVLVGVARGQGSGFGTITGRAIDPKGASVPNAKVTVTNAETGIARTSTT